MSHDANPQYSIYVVESYEEDGSTKDVSYCMSTFPQSLLFEQILFLYNEFNTHGGFMFPTDSIAMRMKSMNKVLCWFGFHENRKYTCFIERVTTS
jgi:hypothetical protein